MIETQGLSKQFESFLAVDAVTLSVQPGEVLALLGPNGAGKTTTVRMLTSILKPSAGWARVAGYDVVRDAAAVRASVGVLTEHHGLYFRMRSDEYLDFFGNLVEAEQLADQIAVIRRGRIITQGSPAALKRQLLGPAVLELRTAAPLNGLVEDLSDLVEIVDAGKDWVRYRAAEPAVVNPLILQRLAAQGVPVVTLAEVTRSLEDVYLQVVEAEDH
ncbi:MAG: ABC transporter ATP-binding protein [Chloroflexi bacterium]|nr:ABC transporter ATP-binding protein [Chloroflexota bacterium]